MSATEPVVPGPRERPRPQQPKPAEPVTALPGAEGGRLDPEEGDSVAREIVRTILFVPRSLFEIAMAPPRLVLWTSARYHLPERFHRFFFNDANTIGLYPTVRFESGFGFSVGAHLEAQFLEHNQLNLFAGTGGQFRATVGGSLVNDGLAGDHLTLGLKGRFERRPNDRFFGFGNFDQTDDIPPVPVSPFTSGVAVDTRYRNQIARISAEANVRAVSSFYIDASGAVARRKRDVSDDGPLIDEVYMPSSLIDFDEYSSIYGEGQLRWDTRRAANQWQPVQVTSAGSLAQVFLGRLGIQDGPGTWRYGGDLQHFQYVGQGPRVISARLHGEAITAQDDEIPFNEVPNLGGSRLLRGYQFDRFRDRVAVVGTLEYQWGLNRNMYTSVFTDVGRVYPSLSDLSFSDLRCGFGLALEIHTRRALIARGSVASSIDGGVFFNLYFEPVFEIDNRVERR